MATIVASVSVIMFLSIFHLCRYLEESPELFVMEYDAAPPEYHRRLA